jgi:hypothetical protein
MIIPHFSGQKTPFVEFAISERAFPRLRVALFMRSPKCIRLETMPFEIAGNIGTFVQPPAIMAFESSLSSLIVVCGSKKKLLKLPIYLTGCMRYFEGVKVGPVPV